VVLAVQPPRSERVLLKSQKMNVGADLVRARHFRGLSIDEISNRTKIRRETLSAIEKNRVDDLSALDWRGALRAYAAEVQLDPDDVIERYVAQFEAQPRVKELADSKWGIDVFPSEATLVPHPVVAPPLSSTPAANIALGPVAAVAVGEPGEIENTDQTQPLHRGETVDFPPPVSADNTLIDRTDVLPALAARVGYRSGDGHRYGALAHGALAVVGLIGAAAGFLLVEYSDRWRPASETTPVASIQRKSPQESNQRQNAATERLDETKGDVMARRGFPEHASEPERPVGGNEPHASPAPTVHFIVDAAEGILFGAVANRRWLPAGNAAPLIREGMQYRLYRLTGRLDERLGGAARPPPETCSNPTVRIADAQPADEDVIAVSGDSNALPRAPSVQSTRQLAYRDRVAQWLRARGIADPSPNITQLLRVDLEGDNVDEVLIAANRLRGAGTSAQPGDYAMVLMRKITAGAVQTIPLAEEYYPIGCIADCAPAAHRVAAVLDVSGDGVMEVVLSWRNYEARGKSIYRAEKGGMVRALAWECAP
jgi:transcriptional regulator with XRE-family HTH domain